MNKIHINGVFVKEYFITFDIENVVATDNKGKKSESLQVTCEVRKDGETVQKIYKISCSEIPQLYNKEYCENKAMRILKEFKIV